MTERLRCRHLVRAARGERGPFVLPGAKTEVAPDRVFDFDNIRVEVTPDLDAGTVSGLCSLTFRARRSRTTLGLDAVEMEIASVEDAQGQALAYEYDDARLVVRFAEPVDAGGTGQVTVRYRARPRRGLYFVNPDDAYPDKPRQMWSQCQDEDARHWFPCPDFPNQKTTTTMVCTVPTGMFVLSNGDLVERTPSPDAATETFTWEHRDPHPMYLVTLVAGEFEEIHEEWQGVSLDYYFPRGRAGDARRSFRATAKILDFFSEYTGVRYPWSKYAQVVVADFIFGGMENTTATTLTDRTLHDGRAHLDFDSDDLVAHEAAHQWFGDLVTCRGWSHAWLNEGFATYFDALFMEHDKGYDEFCYYMLQLAEEYMEEDASSYRRAIVTREYLDPLELFDRHLYQKGGCVLHMLRYELGDDELRASLKTYLERHRSDNVETVDLARAIEGTTGRNLDWFFDQWVFAPGHPDLDVRYEWDTESREARLTIKQTQNQEDGTPVHRLGLPIRFVFEDGSVREQKVDVRTDAHVLALRFDSAPVDVLVDPANIYLKTLKLEKPTAMWRRTLTEAPESIARALAARALGRLHEPGVVEALAAAVRRDDFWAVRAEAARALGKLRTTAARDALLAAWDGGISHSKARRAVVAALGGFRRDERAGALLARVLDGGDESYFVEYESLRSLGRGRFAGAFDRLVAARDKASWGDILQRGALEGLGELRDDRGIEVALGDAAYGRPERARRTAALIAGKLGEGKRRVAEELAELLDDPDLLVRLGATVALADIGHRDAIPALERFVDRELDGRGRREGREALRALRTGGGRDAKLQELRDQLDTLHEETRTLRDRLARVESKVDDRG